MKYYFYCPNCGHESETDALPKGVVGNCRDGYGTPIHHYECQKCHNLDAGYMRFDLYKLPHEDQKGYFRSVISLYQGIRRIKIKEDKNEAF